MAGQVHTWMDCGGPVLGHRESEKQGVSEQNCYAVTRTSCAVMRSNEIFMQIDKKNKLNNPS